MKDNTFKLLVYFVLISQAKAQFNSFGLFGALEQLGNFPIISNVFAVFCRGDGRQNEIFSICGNNACQNTCKNFTMSNVCNGACIAGCICASGYLRNSQNRCVLPQNCDGPIVINQTCTGVNEVFSNCGDNGCQPNCTNQNVGFCIGSCGSPKCICASGYIRNSMGTCILPTNCRDDATLEKMKLRYYIGSRIEDYVDIPMTQSEQLIDRPEFSKTRKTVFLVHGFTESVTDPSVRTMVNAYLDAKTDVNLVAVDWSPLSGGDYLTVAIGRSRKVGESLGHKIKNMVDKGLKMNLMHIVGHSLGSHVSGFAGKILINNYSLKLNRITALDPAGPGFYPVSASSRLDVSDAIIVDSILTDPKQYGYPASIGKISFWPNKGSRVQPGCPRIPEDIPLLDDESFCSHRRSWMYWSESLKNKDAFKGFNNNANTYATMGEAYDGRNGGDFTLKTNSVSPFGLGDAGAV